MITGYYIQPMQSLPGRFALVRTNEKYEPEVMLDCLPYDRAVKLYWRYMRQWLRDRARRERAPEPTLFELRDDVRPASQQSAAGRFLQPTLFEERLH
jgi:hypothetical protein